MNRVAVLLQQGDGTFDPDDVGTPPASVAPTQLLPGRFAVGEGARSVVFTAGGVAEFHHVKHGRRGYAFTFGQRRQRSIARGGSYVNPRYMACFPMSHGVRPVVRSTRSPIVPAATRHQPSSSCLQRRLRMAGTIRRSAALDCGSRGAEHLAADGLPA